MASISSDDCKTFLETKFHHPAKEWKRISKKKDAIGRVLREFFHPIAGTVVLAENPQGHIITQLSSLSAPVSVLVPAVAPALLPAPSQLEAWDLVRKEFDPVHLASAERIFDEAVNHDSVTLNTSVAGYCAMPGLFEFSFMDEAGEQSNAIEAINKAKDPNGIVAGFSVFITPVHRDYGCNHLSWAIQSFLPSYFEEVEESTFALYAKWSRVYDDERQDAVDNGTIAQVRLMEVMRDLSSRGFRYEPDKCVFATLLALGKTYCAEP